MLDLEQQSYFALGYRQMTAELNKKLHELRKQQKEKETVSDMDEEE